MTAKGLLSTEKIVLVGAGNVATHLGTALRDAGYAVLQVFSRTEESASALAGKLNCPYTTDINQVVPDAELYVVSVKDAVLAEVIPPLVRRNPKALFVHTAGSMPMDVWKGEAVRYGVLYPMQTFSKSRAVDFSTVPFFIEGSGREEAEALKAVAAENWHFVAWVVGQDSVRAADTAIVMTGDLTAMAVFAENLSNENPAACQFRIYPNPAWQNFVVASDEMILRLEVFDAAGRLVFRRENVNTDRLDVDVSAWPDGVYFVLVSDSKRQSAVRRMVVGR